ncbi:MAG: biotin--[acetyl-CoA-carboxylase] ligase [Planctomycetaceae bacterium]|nr:biotin--[acetyl-CoA-carboxylase] ligase [Planctomycetaceae bacterium]
MTVADMVLTLLYDRGDVFFSLEELARGAGCTRAKISEAIEELRHRGHQIEDSPAQGVRLARPVRLDGCLIERDLGVTRVGRSVLCFDAVDSTNDVALTSARQGGTDGLAVTAESQRRGRGRRGRTWVSPAGQNLLTSLLLLDSGGLVPHEALTIAAGLAVAEAVADACGVQCQLKWPNDVLLDGAKLAGVLVERHSRPVACMVAGIGINVNAAPAAGEVDQSAACLSDVLGHAVERVEVMRSLLRRLDHWVGLISRGRVDALRRSWLARCGMIETRVTVQAAGKRYVGRVVDVSPLEGLVLACDGGTRVHLAASDATVLR